MLDAFFENAFFSLGLCSSLLSRTMVRSFAVDPKTDSISESDSRNAQLSSSRATCSGNRKAYMEASRRVTIQRVYRNISSLKLCLDSLHTSNESKHKKQTCNSATNMSVSDCHPIKILRRDPNGRWTGCLQLGSITSSPSVCAAFLVSETAAF